MRLKVALIAALASILLGPSPVQAEDVSVISTVPGAIFHGYASPVTVVTPGAAFHYLNFDIFQHDVVSRESGPDTQPWCKPPAPCPLLHSELIGPGEQTEVQGTENLEPGKRYSIFCTLHPSMKGTIVVP
ncbi:MAG TPA: plastocyanin/azurin family copper-binding protein [Actinomycetota bacterium]|jgi:plastocyanin|nr:plastocyanin/azurin family copper-binding protein [Actinomycetota bacterium]